ncbi:hypothetical protein ACFFLS_01375 [Flavobacterium procerum]|uniref:Uncharacterized protein n=1 Tax=Flavobacterium procerum TaxID=1455569 RepID=A0ABV6BJQ5_9FLAO
MDLLEKTIHNTKELYSLALKYFQNMDPAQYHDVEFDSILPKSISILIDHDFIPTPCIEIKLELYKNQIKSGNYFLYLNENKEFVDEFLY